MNKLLSAAALTSMFLLVATTLVAADGGKALSNTRGDVAYQHGTTAPVALAQSATMALHDSDYAITGKNSLAAIALPDSSQVEVGSNTKVQMAFFNQAKIASAKFIIYHGKTRFTVKHPKGAKANYTFATPTIAISVRGTQGDIGVAADGAVRVNVYQVSNPDLPVTVETPDGQTFTLHPGDTLLAHEVNGVLEEEKSRLTQQLVDQFSPDFGVPSNWAQLKQMLIQKVLQSIPAPPIPVPVSLP